MWTIEEDFRDHLVDEVLINGTSCRWVFRPGDRRELPAPFADNEALISWVQDLASQTGVRLDPLQPASGGVVAGQPIRWHCILPPACSGGPVVSFRRQRHASLLLQDFAWAEGTRTKLDRALTAQSPLLICGPTSSGKTSLLASILNLAPVEERVVILEQIAEIPLLRSSWVRLVERGANSEGLGEVTLSRLFEESLRLRPDRYVVGEIRGREAPIFLRALMTGHQASVATMHASNIMSAIQRVLLLSQAFGEHISKNDLLNIFAESDLYLIQIRRGVPCQISEIYSLREYLTHAPHT